MANTGRQVGGHSGGRPTSGSSNSAPRQRVSLEARPYGANSSEEAQRRRQRRVVDKGFYSGPQDPRSGGNLQHRSREQSQQQTGGFHSTSRAGSDQKSFVYGKKQSKSRSRVSARAAQRNMLTTFGIVLLVAAVGFVAFRIALTRTVVVSINGDNYSIKATTTYNDLVNEGYISVKNGDLVAVDYSLLGVGGGKPFTVTCNDTQITNFNKRVKGKSIIVSTSGEETFESADITEETTNYGVELIGDDSVGDFGVVVNEGADGVEETRVGKLSGKTYVEQVSERQDKLVFYYYPSQTINTDKIKPICLLFAGGPSKEGTQKILDKLAEYDVKATFAFLGTSAAKYKSVAQAVVDAGMEVASNSYDSGKMNDAYGDLRQITSTDDLLKQVEKGFSAVEEATGVETSTLVAPNGNFNQTMWQTLCDTVTLDLHWNCDSQDTVSDDPTYIADTVTTYSWPGGVILCHDAGPYVDAMCEALDIIIPTLTEQGYTFVTASEMVDVSLPTEMQIQATDETRTVMDRTQTAIDAVEAQELEEQKAAEAAEAEASLTKREIRQAERAEKRAARQAVKEQLKEDKEKAKS